MTIIGLDDDGNLSTRRTAAKQATVKKSLTGAGDLLVPPTS
jgi:hypothetical protein